MTDQARARFDAPELPGDAPRVKLAPGGFALAGEDNLRITSYNALAGVVLRISGRFLVSGGAIIPIDRLHTPNSNRTAARELFSLGPGVLLNLTIIVSSGAPLINQTFVRAEIVRGLTGNTILLGTLVADAVTAVQSVGWPGGLIRRSLDGPPYPRTITGALPAVGTEIIETVPTGARWTLLAFGAELSSSVAAPVRRVHLTLPQGPSPYVVMPQDFAHGALVVQDYYWFSGSTRGPANSQTASIAALLNGPNLLAGTSFGTLTDNIQAADVWTRPTYFVHEWLEGA